jgi:hypothetical protein
LTVPIQGAVRTRNTKEVEMANVKVKMVVTGTAVTTLDYSIVNAPEAVVKEVDLLVKKGKFDQDASKSVSGVGGENLVHILLSYNDIALIDKDLPIKKIAKIEAKLLQAMGMLLSKHS